MRVDGEEHERAAVPEAHGRVLVAEASGIGLGAFQVAQGDVHAPEDVLHLGNDALISQRLLQRATVRRG